MPKGIRFVIENVLKLPDRAGRRRRLMGSQSVSQHLIGGRRSRRLEEEAAEVAEIDRWLADMRNQPELVLYPSHPTSTTPVHPTPAGRVRAKKRRR